MESTFLPGIDDYVDLAVSLLRCADAKTALEMTVSRIHDLVGAPVGGVIHACHGLPAEVRLEGVEPSSPAGTSLHRWPEQVAGDLASLPLAALRRRLVAALGSEVVIEGSERITLFAQGSAGSIGEALSRGVALIDAVLERVARDGERLALSEDRTSEPSPEEKAAGGFDAAMGLAWTAHELRGPLVDVWAVLDRVRTDDRGDPIRVEELLARSQRELERLHELVDPLLRWSTEPGRLDLVEADLVEVVRGAVESASLGRSEERIVVADDGPIPVLVDVPQLGAAVVNLIRNSLAYSPADSMVVVTVSRRLNEASISVLDGGPGVDRRELPDLFKPFSRGMVGTAVRSGSGLGLYITKSIVEAHGGRLEFQPWGGGAVFRIDLPRGSGGGTRSGS